MLAAAQGVNFMGYNYRASHGVATPVFGRFTTPAGMPLELRADEVLPDDPDEFEFFRGMVFSKDEAFRAFRRPEVVEYVSGGTCSRVRDQIRASGLPKYTPKELIARMLADFNRPMLDWGDNVSGLRTISVFKRGQILRFGQHPLAGTGFSVLGMVSELHRMAEEKVVAWEDHPRLQADLLTEGRFPGLPNGNPDEVADIREHAFRFPQPRQERGGSVRVFIRIGA